MVEEAEETSFFTSGFALSGTTFGAGFGGALLLGNGYFLGRPRPRPDVELPDCLRSSFVAVCGLSSSDSEEFEKILLSFFTFDAGGGFFGTGRLLAVLTLLDATAAGGFEDLLCCCIA